MEQCRTAMSPENEKVRNSPKSIPNTKQSGLGPVWVVGGLPTPPCPGGGGGSRRGGLGIEKGSKKNNFFNLTEYERAAIHSKRRRGGLRIERGSLGSKKIFLNLIENERIPCKTAMSLGQQGIQFALASRYLDPNFTDMY